MILIVLPRERINLESTSGSIWGVRVGCQEGMSQMLRVLLAFVIVLATCGTAQAQYTPFRLPDHVTVQVDGVRHEAFALEGFRELLLMDEDLRHFVTMNPLLERRLEVCTEQLTAALSAADLRLQDISTLRSERDRLQTAWTEENRLRLEAENVPDIGTWLGYGLAGVFGVATVVLAIVLGASGGI